MSSFQLECSVLKKSWGNLLFVENEMTREKLENIFRIITVLNRIIRG